MFTTMCPKEQQTSDNPIVKDYCFIIKIFDKFSFSCILRGMFNPIRTGIFETCKSEVGGGGVFHQPS